MEKTDKYFRTIEHEDLIISFELDFSVKTGISARNVSVTRNGSEAPLTGELYEKINMLVEEEEAMINLYEYNDFFEDHINSKAELQRDNDNENNLSYNSNDDVVSNFDSDSSEGKTFH